LDRTEEWGAIHQVLTFWVRKGVMKKFLEAKWSGEKVTKSFSDPHCLGRKVMKNVLVTNLLPKLVFSQQK
jgi:hypothetical protein